MVSYIAKRLLYSVPTLILVSILAFGLSRLTQADPTAAMLALQGVEPGTSTYEQAYQNLYLKDKRNKPAFYLSLRPQYVTTDINSLVDPRQRAFVQELTDQRYASEYALQIWSALASAPATAALSVDQLATWMGTADVASMRRSNLPSEDPLAKLIATAQEHRHQRHYPSLIWHGVDCQYHHWVSQLLAGDMGVSKVDGRSTASKIETAIRWTLLLLVLNILITLALSVPYGLYTGLHIGSRFDRWTGSILFAVFSMPTFWLATVMVLFLTTREFGLQLFPSVGIWYQASDTSFWQMMGRQWPMLILPLTILVIKDIAYLGRMIRDTVAKEATKPYATAALAKGVHPRRYAYRHILPNALGPAITLAVGAIPASLGGSLLIEVIFNIPGMGRLMYTSITGSDWAVVFPIVLLTAVVTICWFLIGDVLIALLNPKVTLDD